MERDREVENEKRRRLLRSAGILTIGGSPLLAGCLSGVGGSGSSTGPNNNNSGNNTSSNNDNFSANKNNSDMQRTTANTNQAVSGGDVVYAPSDDAQVIHPHYRIARASSQLLVNIVEPLFRLNDDLKAEPHLAKDYSINDDGTTYTFSIREGVMFHPPVSREMTAEDVVASLKQIKEDKQASQNTDFQVVEEVKQTEKFAVELSLKHPFGPLLSTVLVDDTAAILPKERLENTDNYVPIGTGPFKFDNRERGNYAYTAKFDDYWQDDLPYFDSLRSRPISEGSVRLQELTTGNVDVATSIPVNQVSKVKNSNDVALENISGLAAEFFSFNCDRSPFDDKRVRQAVKYAIDYPSLLDLAMQGYGKLTPTTLPEQSPYAIDAAPPSQDLEKAKSLLQDAGYSDGFEASLKLPQSYPRSVKIGTPVKQWLGQIGIQTDLQRITWDTWISDVFGKVNYDMTTAPFYSIYNPYSGLNKIFQTNGTFNYFNYSSEEMDSLLQKGARETNEDKRMEIYKNVQELLIEDTPLFLPFHRDLLFGRKAKVQNKLVWGSGQLRLWHNWFNQK